MDKTLLTPMLTRAAPPVADLERPGLMLRVRHDLGIGKLRVAPSDADASFQRIAGFAPPPVGRQVERDTLTFGWMAPGEWLVTGPEPAVATWVTEATEKGADEVLAIDFTHARVAFELSGNNTRAALAAHCPLDLWPDAFPVNAVARSLLGETVMSIARLADNEDGARFRIIVDQTMAPYARRLFAGA